MTVREEGTRVDPCGMKDKEAHGCPLPLSALCPPG